MQQWPDATHLDETLAFVAVAEHRSFTQAAAALGRDATVLSRRVSALERRLGVRLLARTTRKVVLTEAGAALFARVSPSLADVREAEAEAASHASGEPHGLLHLALPASFGRMWIAPLLPDFLQRHPKLRIQAEFSNRFVDLVGGGFDAAIRIGALPDSQLVARQIAGHRRLLCASPAYLAQRGRPAQPQELAQHACLGFSGFASHPDWRLTRRSDGERVTVRIHPPLETDDAEALVEAAVQGVGIMMCSDWLVGRQLVQGRLVPVLEEWTLEDEGAIHVVVPSSKLMAGKTRAFIDWIAGRFATLTPWSA